jgi:5,10-methenyltetrahydromethanopterin hydrogenase
MTDAIGQNIEEGDFIVTSWLAKPDLYPGVINRITPKGVITTSLPGLPSNHKFVETFKRQTQIIKISKEMVTFYLLNH